MSELQAITNSIADEYLMYSGRGLDSKTLLTPQEYLLFRSQALEEMRLGLHINNNATNHSHETSATVSQPVSAPISNETQTEEPELFTEHPPEDSPLIKDDNDKKKSATQQIIPFSSASKKPIDPETQKMLEIMQKTEG